MIKKSELKWIKESNMNKMFKIENKKKKERNYFVLIIHQILYVYKKCN